VIQTWIPWFGCEWSTDECFISAFEQLLKTQSADEQTAIFGT
jgi:hypothetical protein